MNHSHFKRSVWLVCLFSLLAGFAHAIDINKPGVVYRIVNKSNGQAVTNGNQSAHDTYLSTAAIDNNSEGQDWMIVPVSAADGIYAFYNPHCDMGIDMAAGAKDNGTYCNGTPVTQTPTSSSLSRRLAPTSSNSSTPTARVL